MNKEFYTTKIAMLESDMDYARARAPLEKRSSFLIGFLWGSTIQVFILLAVWLLAF